MEAAIRWRRWGRLCSVWLSRLQHWYALSFSFSFSCTYSVSHRIGIIVIWVNDTTTTTTTEKTATPMAKLMTDPHQRANQMVWGRESNKKAPPATTSAASGVVSHRTTLEQEQEAELQLRELTALMVFCKQHYVSLANRRLSILLTSH